MTTSRTLTIDAGTVIEPVSSCVHTTAPGELPCWSTFIDRYISTSVRPDAV